MFGKRKIAALAAEFLGTGVLALTFLAISRSQLGLAYFVGLAAGLAVILMGLALARDVHLNPAYTFALLTARRIKAVKGLTFILAQLAGGYAAYWLFRYLTKDQLQTPSVDFDFRILLAEALGTFVFAFAAAGVMYQRVHWIVRAFVVGGAYTVGIMIASIASNSFINPAVALATGGWDWPTTVAGPFLGAIIGVNLYGLLFAAGETTTEAKVAVAETATGRPVTKTAVVTETVKPAAVRGKVGRPKGSTTKKRAAKK